LEEQLALENQCLKINLSLLIRMFFQKQYRKNNWSAAKKPLVINGLD